MRHGLDRARSRELLDTLAAFARDLGLVNDLMLSSRSVQARFRGVGTVSRQAALDLGLVGLAARASGVALDARRDLPGPLYREHPVDTPTEAGGDCWARLRLRMREIDASLAWIRRVLLAADGAVGALGAPGARGQAVGFIQQRFR